MLDVSEEERTKVIARLSGADKYVSSKYHYDERGSRLFEEITGLDEYYLTRTERSILRAVMPSLVSEFKPATLVELGADVGLSGGFSVASTFTWMDSEDVNDVENPVGESFSSKFTGTVRYELPGRFWTAAEVRHNGVHKDVDFGTANPVGAVLPSFMVFNMRAGVTTWRSDSGITQQVTVALTNLKIESAWHLVLRL